MTTVKNMEKKKSIRHKDYEVDERAREIATKAMRDKSVFGRVIGHPAFGPVSGGLIGLQSIAPYVSAKSGKNRALIAAIGIGSGALGGYLGTKGGNYLGKKLQGKIPETMWHPDFKKEYQKALKKEKTSMANCYGKLKKMEKKSHVMRAFFDEVGNLTKKAEGPFPKFPGARPPPLPNAASAMGGRKPLMPEVAYPQKQPVQAAKPAPKLPTSDKGVEARGKAYQNPGNIVADRIQRGKAKADARANMPQKPPKKVMKNDVVSGGVHQPSPTKKPSPRIRGKSGGGIHMGHIGGAAALAAGMYAAHKMNQPDQPQQY